MKKFVKCSHCGNCEWFDIDVTIAKFDHRENEILQKECLKLQKRIDKLQHKHDYEDLSNWKLNEVNEQISALTKIQEILEWHI